MNFFYKNTMLNILIYNILPKSQGNKVFIIVIFYIFENTQVLDDLVDKL